MNRIYRVVFNHVSGTWVAVAETAKGRTKSKTSGIAKSLAIVLAVAAVTGVAVPRRAEAYVAGTGAVQGNAGNTVVGDGAVGPTGACLAASGIPTACSTVIGNGANTTFQSSTIIGDHANTTGIASVAIGSWATAGAYSQAVGAGANASGDHATAIGQSALATKTDASAIGTNAQATGLRAVSIGSGSKAIADDAFAIGWGTTASGVGSMAIGKGVTVSGTNSIAFGTSSTSAGNGSVAFGGSSNAAVDNSTAIGTSATAVGTQGATAIGWKASADSGTTTGAWSGTAVGTNSATLGDGSVALGDSAKALADKASAIGRGAQASAQNATAMGAGAGATATNTLALGSGASATTANSVALGAGSVTSATAPTGNGYLTNTAAPASEVSVGSATARRRITNLADGSAPQDAVTVAQLSTGVNSLSTGIASVSTGLSTTNSNVTSLSTSASTGLSTVTSSIGSLSTGLSATNSSVSSLSTSASTGLSTTNSAVNSLSTSASTGVASLSTGLSSTNSNVNSLSASTSTGIASLSTGVISLSTGLSSTNSNVANLDGRVTKNEGDITNLDGRVTINEGDITNIKSVLADAVFYDTSAHDSVTLGGVAATAPVALKNVKDGDISSTSTDAINGSQLNTTNTNVTNLDGRVTKNESDITNLDGRVTTSEGDITNIKGTLADAVLYDASAHDSVTLGGVAATAPVALKNVKDGDVSATSTDAINGSQLNATNTNVTNLDGRVTKNEGDITNLDGRVTTNEGDITNIKGTLADAVLYDTSAHDSVTLGGAAATAPVALKNVKDGDVSATSTDAVNGSQLKSVQDQIGGLDGLAVKYGDISKGTITLEGAGGTTITNLKDGDVSSTSTDAINGSQLNATNTNVTNLDGRVTKSEGDITNLDGRVTTNEGDITSIKGTLADAVLYDSSAHDSVTLGGAAATAPVALKNVKDGDVSATSTDAVNGSQLKSVQDQIGGLDGLAVKYDDISKGSITLEGTGGTTITNLKDGEISATSTDAINGSQLNKTNTNLTNATRYFKADGKNDGSDDAVVSGNNAVAVGANAQAKFDDTIAIGNGAAANWTSAIAIGSGAAAAQESVALGHNAKARNSNDTAIGSGATANLQSTAVGAGATAISAGTALGQGAQVLGANGVALGVGAMVAPTISNSVALGAGSIATRNSTVDVGGRQIASLADGVEANDAVNVSQLKGVQDQIGDLNALAVTYTDAGKTDINLGNGAGGTTVIHNVGDGVAATDAVNKGQLDSQIGNVTNNLANATRYFKADGKNDGSDDASVAAGSNSVAIGAGSVATRNNVLEVGGRQISGVAAGSEDTDAVNVKQLKDAGLVDAGGNALDAVVYDAGSSKASVTFAGVNGTVLNNVADGNIAAGSRQAVNGGQIAALRDSLQSQITNVDNRVTNIENNGGGSAPDPHFVSAGDKSQAAVVTPGSSSVGVGENAQATASNAVAIGANSVANQANTVSVGSAGNERAIVNVAEGVASTDAVNVGQMNNMVNSSAAQTLQSANDYTDQRFSQVNNAINEVDKAASRGIAAAAALNNVTPYVPGKTSLNAGIASYRGSTALGVTVSRWNQRGNVNLNAGFSSAGNNSTIVRAGVGVVFGN